MTGLASYLKFFILTNKHLRMPVWFFDSLSISLLLLSDGYSLPGCLCPFLLHSVFYAVVERELFFFFQQQNHLRVVSSVHETVPAGVKYYMT